MLRHETARHASELLSSCRPEAKLEAHVMVIVKLWGGMGNQLFQYAAGRRLAHSLGTQLKLDIGGYKHEWLRSYCLHPLNIIEDIAGPDDLRSISDISDAHRGFTTLTETRGLFNPHVLEATGNCYLVGNWQSEKYFEDIEHIIRSEYVLREELEGPSREVEEIIRGTEAVCVTVRRGDYVTVKAVSRIYGTCSLEYYRKSADFIARRCSDPHFFVFSDDPQWVRSNMRLPYRMTFVLHNYKWKHSRLENLKVFRLAARYLKTFIPCKSHEDLRLGALCKHFIIANSTFSWWGAWLGRHPEKIVCVPKHWFNEVRSTDRETMLRDQQRYEDLIPQSWHRM
jgi:hypothetical protein